MNYETYRFSAWEFVGYMFFYISLSACLAWIFYQDIRGTLLAFLLVPAGMKRKRRQLQIQRQRRLSLQFKDCIRLVANALAAGYSIENAWREAEADLCRMYGKNADMCLELAYINSRVRLNETIESSLEDFAGRSGLEDVNNFYQVFAFAKRGGGNFVRIIESCAKQIGDKREIMREIETVTASKRLEQKLMNVIPILLLAYVEISSPDFMEPLFWNLFGVCVMSICLLVYGAAFFISEKITEIEV